MLCYRCLYLGHFCKLLIIRSVERLKWGRSLPLLTFVNILGCFSCNLYLCCVVEERKTLVMPIKIITADTAKELKDQIDAFSNKHITKLVGYYKSEKVVVNNVSIVTNGNDYIATVDYYLKGVM